MANDKLQVILTGATGMVGEGVLLTCLEEPAVERVLMLNRRSYPLEHEKLTELIVPDFMQIDAFADQLTGYNACFYCAGISSVGLSEAEYTHITYDVTTKFAETLARLNPAMTFVYVSGAGTDSTEKGRSMWARVKGRTENALGRLGFRAEYNFRPGFMKRYPGQKNVKGYYFIFEWMYPLLRAMNYASKLQEVGAVMIRAALRGASKTVLEVKDINALGDAQS